MTAPDPLTLEDLERLARKQTGCTNGGCVFGHPGGMHTNGGCKCVPHGGHVHPDEARAVRVKVKALVADRSALLAALRSVMAERDALRAAPTGIGRFIHSAAKANAEAADLRARLSRAREALGSFDENPPPYRAGHLVEGEWRIHQARALAALRAALAEDPPPGGP